MLYVLFWLELETHPLSGNEQIGSLVEHHKFFSNYPELLKFRKELIASDNRHTVKTYRLI